MASLERALAATRDQLGELKAAYSGGWGNCVPEKW